MEESPRAQDNGCCPHCGRSDAVKENESKEVFNRAEFQRFICDGCGSMWTGVRSVPTDRRRVAA